MARTKSKAIRTAWPERNDSNSSAQEEADNAANQVPQLPMEDVVVNAGERNQAVESPPSENTEDTEMPADSMPDGKKVAMKRKKKKAAPVKWKEVTSGRVSCSLLGIAKEEGRGSMYGIAFNHWCLSKDIFATCADTNITFYEADLKLPGGFKVLFTVHSPEECYYSCDWSFRDDRPKTHLLIAAGKSGYIHPITIDGRDGHVKQGLPIGKHMGSVNDVKVSRLNPQLLATGSTDYSVRLWNVKTKVVIAIFCVNIRKRDHIVSVSFHDHHPLIIATGLDHSIYIWNYGRENVQQAIQRASTWKQHPNSFSPVVENIPHWFTRDVHSDFVDCIAWWGDWVISSGVEQELTFWQCGREGDNLMELKCDHDALLGRPESEPENSEEDEPPMEENIKKKGGKATQIFKNKFRGKYAKPGYLGPDVRIAKRFDIPNSRVYYMRFSLDYEQKLLSIGNCAGELFLFYLGTKKDCEKGFQFSDIKPLKVQPFPALKGRFVRQTAFNSSGSLMAVVTDECSVAVYHVVVRD